MVETPPLANGAMPGPAAASPTVAHGFRGFETVAKGAASWAPRTPDELEVLDSPLLLAEAFSAGCCRSALQRSAGAGDVVVWIGFSAGARFATA